MTDFLRFNAALLALREEMHAVAVAAIAAREDEWLRIASQNAQDATARADALIARLPVEGKDGDRKCLISNLRQIAQDTSHTLEGFDRAMIRKAADALEGAPAEGGPTDAQLSCGYCLYGEPASCTCGTCKPSSVQEPRA